MDDVDIYLDAHKRWLDIVKIQRDFVLKNKENEQMRPRFIRDLSRFRELCILDVRQGRLDANIGSRLIALFDSTLDELKREG